MNNENEHASINLTAWDGGIGVNYLTRRMILDEDGEVESSDYLPNPNADFDEGTIRLLEDTLKGMEAALTQFKKDKKEEA